MFHAKVLAFALAMVIALPGIGEARRQGGPGRSGQEAGEFDYYVMALSWSPTYCADAGQRDNGPQCSGQRPYAFVLHGLWPQYNRGWPQFCETQDRPWVPESTIGNMLDIMPSKKLIINEYKKHGTCTGMSPAAYFDTARKLYDSIKIPERYRLPDQPLQVSPGEVVKDFTAANPALKPEMIAVSCGGRRLKELRVCFSRDLKPQACGQNENAERLCSRDEVVMPPVRAGRGS
jgi:ribonuclease T2